MREVPHGMILNICHTCDLEWDQVRSFVPNSKEELPLPEFQAFLCYLAAAKDNTCVVNPTYFAVDYMASLSSNLSDLADRVFGDLTAALVLIPAPLLKENAHDIMQSRYCHWVRTVFSV